jgi:hypothetical protein
VKNVEERDKQITLQKLKARNIGIKALYPKKAMPDEPSAEPKKLKLPKEEQGSSVVGEEVIYISKRHTFKFEYRSLD